MPASLNNLPSSPFGGQEFIDSHSIRWVFDEGAKCWRSRGEVRKIDDATATATGLLSPAMKTLLDSIPERGGGFGIISKPLMSVVPLKRDVLYRGTVERARVNEAGSEVVVSEALSPGEFVGKAIFFTKGILKARAYTIFDNDQLTFFLLGTDSSQAKAGDTFEVIEPLYLNQDGAIVGDIQIVSYSLDINCIDNQGRELEGCDTECLATDAEESPPGLDITFNEDFVKELCIEIPGVPGPRGDRGPKGESGKDGTGDGPEGEEGDAGADATETPSSIVGIDVRDTSDIYDTAVLGMELDAASGKLYVIKGKVKTPNKNRPAEQVVATSLGRDLVFTDSDYEYEIRMPAGDPIGASDVSILHYPKHFKVNPETDANKPLDTDVGTIKLSAFVNAMVRHIQDEVATQSDKYDQQIKPFIEEKDEQARSILLGKADEVAKCEWGLGLDFCLGVLPGECGKEEPETVPFPRAEEILGPGWQGAVATPLPPISVPVSPPPTRTPTPASPPNTPFVPTVSITPGNGGNIGDGGIPGDMFPPTIDLTDRSSRNTTIPDGEGSVEIDPSDYPWVEEALGPGSAEADKPIPVAPAGSEIAEPNVSIKDNDGNTTLDGSAIIIEYKGGAARTADTTYSAEVVFEYRDETGNSGTEVFVPSDAAQLSNWDADEFERSAKDSDPVIILLEAPGEILAYLNLPTGVNAGTDVEFSVTQVHHPDNIQNAQIPLRMNITRDASGNTGVVAESPAVEGEDCPDCPEDICVQITAMSQTSGDPGGGANVTLTGLDFGDVTGTVHFGSEEANIVGWSDTTINVEVPESVVGEGSVDVVVQRNDGETGYAPAVIFPGFLAPPTITAVSPAAGSSAGGTSITITGTNFGSSFPTVEIGGIPQTVDGSTPTEVAISSDTGGPPGDVDVVLTNVENGKSVTAPNAYEWV